MKKVDFMKGGPFDTTVENHIVDGNKNYHKRVHKCVYHVQSYNIEV